MKCQAARLERERRRKGPAESGARQRMWEIDGVKSAGNKHLWAGFMLKQLRAARRGSVVCGVKGQIDGGKEYDNATT